MIQIYVSGPVTPELVAAIDKLNLSYRIFSASPEASTGPVDPVEVKPIGQERIPLKSLLGARLDDRGGNMVFMGIDQDVNYEVAEEKLWPRGTKSNPGHYEQWPSVPDRFILPKGWGWFKSSVDDAYAIIPELTKEPGPDWLLLETAKPDTITKTPGSWRYPTTRS